MYLSRFETYLEFEKKQRVATPALSIFRVLTGKEEPPDERPREPGVRLRDAKLKTFFYWNYDSCTAIYEDNRRHDLCIANTVGMLDKIDKIAPMLGLDLVRLRVDWILPVVKYDFKSLEKKYREHFLKEYALFENCYDSSVVVDMKRNNWTLHHQSGPMDIAQLQGEYRVFPMGQTKDKLFLFLNNEVESEEKIRYTNKKMKEFLDGAFKMCENHSVIFQEMMEGIL